MSAAGADLPQQGIVRDLGVDGHSHLERVFAKAVWLPAGANLWSDGQLVLE